MCIISADVTYIFTSNNFLKSTEKTVVTQTTNILHAMYTAQ